MQNRQESKTRRCAPSSVCAPPMPVSPSPAHSEASGCPEGEDCRRGVTPATHERLQAISPSAGAFAHYRTFAASGGALSGVK